MENEESLAVKIDKKHGEQTRFFLRKHELLRTDLKIKRDDTSLFIPVKNSTILERFNLVKLLFEKTKNQQSDYQDLISLPRGLQHNLPTSFDIIGDILLIKLSEGLQPYSSEIGKALLKTHSHVNTVCQMNPVSGEFRKRNVAVIAGKRKTVTIHKEYGLWFKIDIEKTYFSPRLASERKRVSELIKKNASVFDMFCGVAPFSIMIAKYAKPDRIISVDKNPDAIQLAKYNLRRNKVSGTITVIEEDAKNAKRILDDQDMVPDHIIMNLPFSAFDFFPIALQCIADGGLIHYYDIINESYFEKRISELKNLAQSHRINLTKTKLNTIKTYAPHEFYIGIDITVSKN